MTAAFERYDESLNIFIRSSIDNAHNEFLQILVNQGLFALMSFVGIIISSLTRWLKNGNQHVSVTICGGAVLGYIIQALFGISSPVSSPFFWIALSFVISEKPSKDNS